MIFKQSGKETKNQGRPLARRFSLIWLYFSLVSLVVLNMGRPASAETLVWKPYLQQLTATSVVILWTTSSGAQPTVRYGSDNSYSQVASGSTRSLPLGTQLHRVELTGLQPDTRYTYKIYTDGQALLSDEFLSFKTAPSPGSTSPFSFIAFGWRLRRNPISFIPPIWPISYRPMGSSAPYFLNGRCTCMMAQEKSLAP